MTTNPARAARRTTWGRVLALLVAVGLAVSLPVPATAADLQTLTVTGAPGADLTLLHWDGSSWGTVTGSPAGSPHTFTTVPGQRYTVHAGATATTYEQYLGGGTWLGSSTAGVGSAVAPADATWTLDLALAPSSSVSGVLAWTATAPGTAEIVAQEWDDLTQGWLARSFTQATGTAYTLRGLVPGRTYSLRSQGTTPQTTPSWLGGSTVTSPGRDAVTTFVAPPGGQTLAGREVQIGQRAGAVTVDLAAFSGEHVDVTLHSVDGAQTRVTTSAPSETLDGLAPGTYWLTARTTTPPYRQGTLLDLQVASGATLAVAPTAAAVDGTVDAFLTVTGQVRVGATLRATTATVPAAAELRSYWTAGGELVGTGPTLAISPALLGRTIHHHVVAAAAGLAPTSATWTSATSTVLGDAPRASVAPHVSGTVKVGRTLSVETGTWSPAPQSIGFTWLRNGAPIPGATDTTYVVRADDVGAVLAVTVTPRAAGHEEATLLTAPTAAVVRGDALKVAATITGTAKVGTTLAGPAVASPWTATYQWKRAGKAIAGATKRTYKVTGKDAGTRLTLTVTTSRAGYETATATSAAKTVAKITPTIKVAAGKKKVTVTVRATGLTAPTGKVTVRYGKKTKTVTLAAKHKGVIAVALPKGTQKVTVTYAGSAQVTKRATATKILKVR